VQAALNKAKASKKEADQLRASPDRHLTVDEIKAHMQNPANHNGDTVPEPGFFSQAPGATGKRAFYKPLAGNNMERPAMYSRHRSGLSTLQGTHDASLEALVAQRARSENAVAQAEGHDTLLSKYGASKDAQGNAGSSRTTTTRRPPRRRYRPRSGSRWSPSTWGTRTRSKTCWTRASSDHTHMQGVSARVQAMFTDTSPGRYTLVPQMVKDKLMDSVGPRGKFRRVAEEFTKHWKASPHDLDPLAGG
jgi:hypothetical protein